MNDQVLPDEKKRVLLIEDDPIIRKMYQEKFSNENFEVSTVENGEQAVPTAKESFPDIILLDLMMPRVDGFVTLKNLKSDKETEKIPVVILSVIPEDTFADEVDEDSKDKIAGYIRKDQNSPAEVVEKVKNILDHIAS